MEGHPEATGQPNTNYSKPDRNSPKMYAASQHDALTYVMYPTVTPQLTTAAKQLDNHHRASLAHPNKRLRRAITTAVTSLRGPLA
jgi:hypothetical protein